MAESESEQRRLARACARRLPPVPDAFHADLPAFEAELLALMQAVAASHERFSFDLDGRPAAIAAIRNALPAMEAELLDAVLDDVACELAATREALYQLAFARDATV